MILSAKLILERKSSECFSLKDEAGIQIEGEIIECEFV